MKLGSQQASLPHAATHENHQTVKEVNRPGKPKKNPKTWRPRNRNAQKPASEEKNETRNLEVQERTVFAGAPEL